jgi:ubiquinol-cytochrome c reductase cytochrome b subunit
LLGLSVLHILLLHISGSTNPLGVCAKMDSVRFYPKYIIKDIFGFFTIAGLLIIFTIFFYPNFLGHPDNYIMANPLLTPTHIVPEFYFLPFYAILRAIPNKLQGVITMFSSIMVLFLLPVFKFKIKSSRFSIISKITFWLFISNFLLLGALGACPISQPYIYISQLSTAFYFSYFLIIIPIISLLENISTRPKN